jgi:hypothetical protein
MDRENVGFEIAADVEQQPLQNEIGGSGFTPLQKVIAERLHFMQKGAGKLGSVGGRRMQANLVESLPELGQSRFSMGGGRDDRETEPLLKQLQIDFDASFLRNVPHIQDKDRR